MEGLDTIGVRWFCDRRFPRAYLKLDALRKRSRPYAAMRPVRASVDIPVFTLAVSRRSASVITSAGVKQSKRFEKKQWGTIFLEKAFIPYRHWHLFAQLG
jgi:hypothetical protein